MSDRLLTGELPFGRESFVDVALRQVERAPELVRNDAPETLEQAMAASLPPDRRVAAGAALRPIRGRPVRP